MGRQQNKINRRQRKNNSKQTIVYDKYCTENKKTPKLRLEVNNSSLPLGACMELNHITTLFLFAGNAKSRKEWNKIRSQLIQFHSKKIIFDNIAKCIVYIRRRHVTHLFLQVWNGDATEIKNIRDMIMNEFNENHFIYFNITSFDQIHFNDRTMVINSLCVDQSYDKLDDNNMSIPLAVNGLKYDQQKSIQDLTKDEIRFMWFQLLIDVLLRLPKRTATMNDMLKIARERYSTDPIELRKINEFACNYNATKAIWWYTNDSFVYRLLNSAFRTQDIRVIFAFRFYIIDLYAQLENIATNKTNQSWYTVFRGQILHIDELETIKQNVGGLISMNTFLSTTLDCQVACMYTGYGSCSSIEASVLFEITFNGENGALFSRPFASIALHSDKHDENEILFGMGSVFRIVSFEQYDSICLVNLEIEHYKPKDCIKEFTTHLRSRFIGSKTNAITLGDLLLEMGEIQQAEQLYSMMIGQQNPDQWNVEIALLQNSIGLWYMDKGDYNSAKILFEQALNISDGYQLLESSLLNNLGLVWIEEGQYERAIKYFKRSKKFKCSKEKKMIIYSNMSSAYVGKGQYGIAKRYADRVLNIEKQHLPSFHPQVAKTYNNLGSIELRMGNYTAALDMFKKALSIYQQCLPPNHHSFAHVLNNIGSVYSGMEDFDQAHEYYQQALKILTESFEHYKNNHPHIAATLNNIAICQFEKKNFQDAETAFKHILQIKMDIFGENAPLHPSLAIAYNNLAMAQMKQSNFDEAMVNYERVLAIEQSTGNPADICITYNNIAGIYDEKNDFLNAEAWYLKAYNTALTVFPNEHPSVQLYNQHIEKVRMKIKRDQ